MNRMKYFFSIVLTLTVVIGFTSCENPNEIGFDLNNQIGGKAIFSDTLSLDVSTVLADSAVNGAANYIMAGFAEDPLFGTTTASAYFQPTLKYREPSIIDTFKISGTNPVIDSIRIRIVHSGLLFGDTITRATFGLYRLKNSMKNGNYDVKDVIETESTPILKFTITPNSFRNVTRDTLIAYFLTLPKTIGTELITAAAANSTDNNKLLSQFKGFAIIPDANAKTLYTFLTGPFSPSTSTIIAYWHTQGDNAQKLYNFDINGPRHSNLKFNRASSKIKDLTGNTSELASTKLAGNSYVQGGSGISTKVNFSNLSKLGTNVKVSRAVLEFTQPKVLNNSLFPKVYSFALAEADTRNQHVRNGSKQLTYVTPIGSDLTGALYSLVDSTNTVSMDITNYVQRLTNKKQYNTSLLVLPAVPTTDGNAILSNDNIRRMVFTKPKLRLYYTKN
jgi:Domain of unknown function (DUF4270)